MSELFSAFIQWYRDHPGLFGWVVGGSAALFVGSLIAIPLMIARMRADYFVSREPGPESWSGQNHAIRVVVLVVKNVVGVVFVLAGLAMLVLPGQGILAILVGISLLNFPGKRRLQLYIARQRHVLRSINWIRARAGRRPLEVPPRIRRRRHGRTPG
jgi:hypothetical protein